MPNIEKPTDQGGFITSEGALNAVDNYANSYVNFTSNLITNTFDALVDSNLQQTEAYLDFIKVLSKDLTTYINDTIDDINPNEVLNFLDTLELEKFKLLGHESEGYHLDIDDANQIIELDTQGNQVKRNDTGDVVKTGGKPFMERFTGGLFGTIAGIGQKIPGLLKDSGLITNLDFDNALDTIETIINPKPNADKTANTITYPQKAEDKQKISDNLFKSIAIRVAKNKYDFLQTMVETGLLRTIVEGGYIKTGFVLDFQESDSYRYSFSEKEKDRSKTKENIREKQKIGFLPFFKRKKKRRFKQKHTHFKVTKTKVNNREQVRAQVNFNAEVKIDFKTDYKPLS